MGDAAHPMYPRGANGAAQAILDAEYLANNLYKQGDPLIALKIYENERLDVANKVVLTNRDQPPDHIIEVVDDLTDGQPLKKIENVIKHSELVTIADRYKKIAKYHKKICK